LSDRHSIQLQVSSAEFTRCMSRELRAAAYDSRLCSDTVRHGAGTSVARQQTSMQCAKQQVPSHAGLTRSSSSKVQTQVCRCARSACVCVRVYEPPQLRVSLQLSMGVWAECGGGDAGEGEGEGRPHHSLCT